MVMPDNVGAQAPRWVVVPDAPEGTARALGVPPLWGRLLYNRGLRDRQQVRAFLEVSLAGLHDPFLLHGMDRAVARIHHAIASGETVAVYGDFDTDGVTATVLLYEGLVRLGGRAIAYIPHRVREGHGLNHEAVARLGGQGVSLVITVDTGVTALEEVEAARRAGMDVVITDHHVPDSTLPSAAAVVTSGHRAYPFPHLTGAGLAFKLLQGLDQRRGSPVDQGALELAALGTVADMAPLQGENRVLARQGLEAIRRTVRPGLLGLLAAAGVSKDHLDHETIPFVIAPRLNAAGRMDTADLSLRLLTEGDAEGVRDLVQELERLNGERRRLTDDLVAHALPGAARQAGEESLLFLEGEAFAPGVSGLVASRMAERFYRPTVVVALDGDIARASARSIPEFDLAAAFDRCRGLFVRSGGHPAAAGFVARVRDLPAIRQSLQASGREGLAGTALAPALRIDAQVSVKELLGGTFDFLRSMAPFGQGNPPPVFLTPGVEVASARAVGAQGQHLQLAVREGGVVWDAVAFGQAWPDSLPRPGAPSGRRGRAYLDIAYTVEVSNFQGRGTVQLRLLGLRPAGGHGG